MKSEDMNIKNTPFSRLVVEDEDLSLARSEYASLSDRERWSAADYQYHSSIASDMFNQAIGMINDEEVELYYGELLALAIDPKYAPALLSVGTIEYYYGRPEEGMKYLCELAALPPDTEDIAEIIDKAGDFLTGNQDYEGALILYEAASNKNPDEPIYHDGLSYCRGKLGQYQLAVDEARITVDLEPDNHIYLSNLGWSLVEAEEYDEAQSVLERAVELSPSDYDMAQANLDELLKRKKKKR